jgi:hypothetical protein
MWLVKGRAMAQAVSRRPLTAEACVQSWWTKWHWKVPLPVLLFSPVSTIPLLFHLITLILLLSKGQVHGAWELSSKATPFRYRGALATKLMSLLSLQLFWLHLATPARNITTVYARVQATCHRVSFARFCCNILKTVILTCKMHWPWKVCYFSSQLLFRTLLLWPIFSRLHSRFAHKRR